MEAATPWQLEMLCRIATAWPGTTINILMRMSTEEEWGAYLAGLSKAGAAAAMLTARDERAAHNRFDKRLRQVVQAAEAFASRGAISGRSA